MQLVLRTYRRDVKDTFMMVCDRRLAQAHLIRKTGQDYFHRGKTVKNTPSTFLSIHFLRKNTHLNENEKPDSRCSNFAASCWGGTMFQDIINKRCFLRTVLLWQRWFIYYICTVMFLVLFREDE